MHFTPTLIMLSSFLIFLGLALAAPTSRASHADEIVPCLEKFAACDFGSPHYNQAVCISDFLHKCTPTLRPIKARDKELEERSADLSTSLEAKSVDVNIEACAKTTEDTAKLVGGRFATCENACLFRRTKCSASYCDSKSYQAAYNLCVLNCDHGLKERNVDTTPGSTFEHAIMGSDYELEGR